MRARSAPCLARENGGEGEHDSDAADETECVDGGIALVYDTCDHMRCQVADNDVGQRAERECSENRCVGRCIRDE